MSPNEVSAAVRRYLLADRQDGVRDEATGTFSFPEGDATIVAPLPEIERLREAIVDDRRKERLRQLLGGGGGFVM